MSLPSSELAGQIQEHSGKQESKTAQLKATQIPDEEITLNSGEAVVLGYEVWQEKAESFHKSLELSSGIFRLSMDGDFHIMIGARQAESLTPLAVVSMIKDGSRVIINMMQRVQAQENLSTQFIEHPLKNLLQGDNKIDWQKKLLLQAENFARDGGFQDLDLNSGFRSPYTDGKYPLTMAVQHYDYLVFSSANWKPLDIDLAEITGEQRKTLDMVIRRFRNKKMTSYQELYAVIDESMLGNFVPWAWRKKL